MADQSCDRMAPPSDPGPNASELHIPREVPVDVDLLVFTESELPNARLGEIVWL